MILQTRGLSFSYGGRTVLHEIDVDLKPGITAIIGPNATGKSTLLKCLCGQLAARGSILLNGQPLRRFSDEQVVRQVSYLPQKFSPRAVMTVFETVLLGRLHRLGWRVPLDDLQVVQQLLVEMKLADLADRALNELSGGQVQMVAIAQALARQPSVLLLDEPTSNLDLRRQFEVCGLVRQLTDSRDLCSLIALHDLNIAARFADTIYVLQDGHVRNSGTPQAVLTEEVLADVFGVETRCERDAQGRVCVTVLGPQTRSQDETGSSER